jgi:pantoate--beta-alanine ligase
MIEFQTSEDIGQWCARLRENGRKVGFVPTMGALHEGHMSLIRIARRECDIVVSSIFVNPTQFNDPADYEQYPVSAEQDKAMLNSEGCDAVFTPAVPEIYPDGREYDLKVDLGYLAECMEAAGRPGHFEGVMQVVKRLLDIVLPDVLYLGRKDYQQFRIVSRMVEACQLPVEVRQCPIIREADGLAMSSRNRRLSPEARTTARRLSGALFAIRDEWQLAPPTALAAKYREILDSDPKIAVEYLEIVDESSLQPLDSWEDAQSAIAFIAAVVGGIRLIDNVIIY